MEKQTKMTSKQASLDPTYCLEEMQRAAGQKYMLGI